MEENTVRGDIGEDLEKGAVEDDVTEARPSLHVNMVNLRGEAALNLVVQAVKRVRWSEGPPPTLSRHVR